MFYKDLMEYSIDLEIDRVLSKYKNVYIMTSDTAINGYEQENMFYKNLWTGFFSGGGICLLTIEKTKRR